MHNCLKNLEIFSDICLYLTKRDLLSTALTCQEFKHTALRNLWFQLPDLSPIIRNLPRDSWKCKRGRRIFGRADEYMATRWLVPSDWDCVLPYLSFVRSICITGWLMPQLSDELYRNLLVSFPGKELFPNIQYLNLRTTFTDASLTFFVKFCLGPRLKGLDIEFNPSSTGDLFIRAIPVFSPSIKKLELHSPSIDPLSMAQAVCQCHHLEELAIPDLSEATFIHISQLPGLRKLVISATGIVQLPLLPHRAAFPSLVSLNLRGAPLSLHTGIHAIITSTQYQYYLGDFDRPATAQEWKDLIIKFQVARPREIRVVVNDKPEDWNNPSCIITSHILNPLLTLTGLTCLVMQSVFTFDLDDAFVFELGQKCPHLQWVELGTTWASGRRSRATLISYGYLIRHCPKLRILGLVVDTSNADRNLQTSPAKGMTKLIRHSKDNPYSEKFLLCVGDSYIEEPPVVASFLSSFVDPNYKDCLCIMTAQGCPRENSVAWGSVEDMIPVFVAARAQERELLI